MNVVPRPAFRSTVLPRGTFRREILRNAVFRRMSRCLLVSVGTTLLSAAVLVALAMGAGVPAGSANVVAVCCGIAPSYFANRHWVWGRSGRSDLVREVAPFWVLSLAGLVVSTVVVALVASATSGWSTTTRALALPVANLSVFGALWLVQFALLDKVLFSVVPNEAPSEIRNEFASHIVSEVPKEHVA